LRSAFTESGKFVSHGPATREPKYTRPSVFEQFFCPGGLGVCRRYARSPHRRDQFRRNIKARLAVHEAELLLPSGGTELGERLKDQGVENINALQEVVKRLSQAESFEEALRIQTAFIHSQLPGVDPEHPRHDLKRPWDAVTKRAGVTGVRLHDLRHTYASFGANGGLGLPIIGRLLGHSQPATTARYAHLDNDPLRRASEAIAERIATALEGKRTAFVTALTKRRTA
jgi:hypothetical protein